MTNDEKCQLAMEITGPIREVLDRMMTLIEQGNRSVERLIECLEILELERLHQRSETYFGGFSPRFGIAPLMHPQMRRGGPKGPATNYRILPCRCGPAARFQHRTPSWRHPGTADVDRGAHRDPCASLSR